MLHYNFIRGVLVVNLSKPYIGEDSHSGNILKAPVLQKRSFEDTRLESQSCINTAWFSFSYNLLSKRSAMKWDFIRLIAIPLLTFLCLATFASADQGRPSRLVTLDNKEILFDSIMGPTRRNDGKNSFCTMPSCLRTVIEVTSLTSTSILSQEKFCRRMRRSTGCRKLFLKTASADFKKKTNKKFGTEKPPLFLLSYIAQPRSLRYKF